jgi:hypothetical protein
MCGQCRPASRRTRAACQGDERYGRALVSRPMAGNGPPCLAHGRCRALPGARPGARPPRGGAAHQNRRGARCFREAERCCIAPDGRQRRVMPGSRPLPGAARRATHPSRCGARCFRKSERCCIATDGRQRSVMPGTRLVPGAPGRAPGSPPAARRAARAISADAWSAATASSSFGFDRGSPRPGCAGTAGSVCRADQNRRANR